MDQSYVEKASKEINKLNIFAKTILSDNWSDYRSIQILEKLRTKVISIF